MIIAVDPDCLLSSTLPHSNLYRLTPNLIYRLPLIMNCVHTDGCYDCVVRFCVSLIGSLLNCLVLVVQCGGLIGWVDFDSMFVP